MLFAHLYPFAIAVFAIALGLAAARTVLSTMRRRLDPGVVSQRWLLTHRTEE